MKFSIEVSCKTVSSKLEFRETRSVRFMLKVVTEFLSLFSTFFDRICYSSLLKSCHEMNSTVLSFTKLSAVKAMFYLRA